MKQTHTVDYVIIGGSAIGLNAAISIKKKHPRASVAILERFDRPGLFATGHNAGLIHSGIHENARHKLKTDTCIRGNVLIQEFCREHGVQLKKTGMLVAVSKALPREAQASASERMHSLAENARKLSINFELMDGRRAGELSGNRVIHEAIHLPDVFLLNIHQYLTTLQRLARELDIAVMYGAHIKTVDQKASDWLIYLADGSAIAAANVINCAGGHADQVASLFGFKIPQHILYQGDFWAMLDEGLEQQVRVPINPVMPEGYGKGVHVYTTLHGEVWLGPVTRVVDDRSYRSLLDAPHQDLDAERLAAYASLFFEQPVKRFVCRDTGFRAKVVPEGIDDDFHFDVLSKSGPHFSSFFGIQSPGLTASIALGHMAASQLA
jgi:L-2-hydroxyglutarate oxidase LhgO